MNTPLHVVVINQVHPLQHHVSARRMGDFARQLAMAGDKVVLITETLKGDDGNLSTRDLTQDFADHDWQAPFHIVCEPIPAPLLQAAREGRMPSGLRQLVLGAAYLANGDVFPDWRRAASQTFDALLTSFKPDVVWGTFGNTATWSIARDLAAKAKCPWVGDMKDNWRAFIPAGFRHLLANRFRDMAHMTVYSDQHRDLADPYFLADKTVIYSGIIGPLSTATGRATNKCKTILLSGSLYDDANVKTILAAVEKWGSQQMPSAVTTPYHVAYAGNDFDRIARVANSLASTLDIKNLGYISADDLASQQKGAFANVHIVNRSSLFQQKFLELLAADRPIIAIPPESHEARHLAEYVDGLLISCSTIDDIVAALDKARDHGGISVCIPKLVDFSLSAQTERLRRVLLAVAERSK